MDPWLLVGVELPLPLLIFPPCLMEMRQLLLKFISPKLYGSLISSIQRYAFFKDVSPEKFKRAVQSESNYGENIITDADVLDKILYDLALPTN